MASVVHPCCVRLRAVCMTAQTMLVSELMPLGCLLAFVIKYENRLTSAILINWSKQIAQVCERIAALIYSGFSVSLNAQKLASLDTVSRLQCCLGDSNLMLFSPIFHFCRSLFCSSFESFLVTVFWKLEVMCAAHYYQFRTKVHFGQ